MKTVELTVNESLIVSVIPNNEFEFLMPTKDVAKGYDISPDTLRSHKSKNKAELTEGKHFISNVDILHGAPTGGSSRVTMWTKAGVIRLGMFIRSERAILFRDWAEQVILEHLSSTPVPNALPPAPKRKHNRLTQERLLSIMQDICLIENNELRIRLSQKLLN